MGSAYCEKRKKCQVNSRVSKFLDNIRSSRKLLDLSRGTGVGIQLHESIIRWNIRRNIPTIGKNSVKNESVECSDRRINPTNVTKLSWLCGYKQPNDQEGVWMIRPLEENSNLSRVNSTNPNSNNLRTACSWNRKCECFLAATTWEYHIDEMKCSGMILF